MRSYLGKQIKQNGSSAHEKTINKQANDFTDNPWSLSNQTYLLVIRQRDSSNGHCQA
jgi:hypothetical protein